MLDLSIVGWRAWYTQGRTFDSDSTLWQDLPPVGVLAIVLYNRTRPKRRVMIATTLYWHDPRSGIYAHDNVEDARLPERLPKEYIKEGRWATDTEFERVRLTAMAAIDAPPKAEAKRVDRQ